MFRLWRRTFSSTSLSVRPDAKTYHVRLAVNRNRVGFSIGLAIGFLALVTGERDANPFKTLISEEPVFIPLGFTKKIEPAPYKMGSKEVNVFRNFYRDNKSRAAAEVAVVDRVLRVMERQRRLDVGRPVHCSRNYWMWFSLAPPPPKYERNYLSLSTKGLDYVTRPVDPLHVTRLSGHLYPRAIATSLYSFGASLTSSISAAFRGDDISGIRSFPRPLAPPPSPSSSSSPPSPQDGTTVEIDGESVVSPMTKIALDQALTASIDTLERNWAKDRKNPPPARGWAVAEGLLHVVGSKLAVVVEVQAAVDPANPTKNVSILSLKLRNVTRAPKGGIPPDHRFQF